MTKTERSVGPLVLAIGPFIVNWWDFNNAYPATALFVGAALGGIYGALVSIHGMIYAGNRMLWKQSYPGEEPLDGL